MRRNEASNNSKSKNAIKEKTKTYTLDISDLLIESRLVITNPSSRSALAICHQTRAIPSEIGVFGINPPELAVDQILYPEEVVAGNL